MFTDCINFFLYKNHALSMNLNHYSLKFDFENSEKYSLRYKKLKINSKYHI